jgi:DNA-binding PadR family transcriptional regulator
VTAGLTPTSYLVLGLVDHLGTATSYQLKRTVQRSIGYFWTFPHSQLYAEPARLTGLGLLAEDQEAGGRRRRTYAITPAGRAALRQWVAEPVSTGTEIRDLALLKLFFGIQVEPADVVAVAEAAAAVHRQRLADYDAIRHGGSSRRDHHQMLTLELGMRYERVAASFWESVAADPGAEAFGEV